MYAPVRYREVDPTIFLCLLFPFIFGFFLTDIVYGTVFALAGVLIVRGIGKTSSTFNSLGWIMIPCGVWAIILGLLTNGFLGDFFQRFIFKDVPNFVLPTTLIDAFALPQIVLIIAIGFGVLHINMGLIIGIINKFRYGKMKEALGENIVWLILEVGLIFLVAGFMIPAIEMIGMVIGGACMVAVLAILLYSNGAFGLMEIFSYMGNILSYARMLALCLSTAGIAMTVNIVAEMLYGIIAGMIPVPAIGVALGLIAFLIIFIFGHIANFLMQIIGGFINAMRLHFVEFFSQFYMGGHNAFKPFSSNRLITKLKK